MKNFIEKTADLTSEEINELLYYYEQGIEVGKEETTLSIINNLITLNFDRNMISSIVNISEAKIQQLLN